MTKAGAERLADKLKDGTRVRYKLKWAKMGGTGTLAFKWYVMGDQLAFAVDLDDGGRAQVFPEFGDDIEAVA